MHKIHKIDTRNGAKVQLVDLSVFFHNIHKVS